MDYLYPFTQEAYALYEGIPENQRDNFWPFLQNGQYIAVGDIIYRYIVEEFCETIGMEPVVNPHEGVHEDILQRLRSGEDVQMEEIFQGNTSLVINGERIQIPYDLEKAEFIYGNYQDTPEYRDDFGTEFWAYKEVAERIETEGPVSAI